ncbi:MAG TPA: hypothetical protein VGB77_17170 [Abditibacteriaceae bacterium]
MQKNESYRQKENRKDNRLILGVFALVFALALGLRWYSDTHQPPVHPLKLTIVERGIPQNPLHSIRDTYLAPGELIASDNMKELSRGRSIEGGETTWELMDVQQRITPGAAWAPPSIPNKAKPPSFPIKLREKDPKYPYWRLNGFSTHAGEWKITVRATRRYYDPESKEQWVGSRKHVITRLLREDVEGARRIKERANAIAYSRSRGLPAPTEIPPAGVHPFDPNKKYVAKLQWSTDDDHWQDVPRKGQKGYPLTIPSDLTVGFRAIKLRPQEPWPDWTSDESDFDDPLAWSGAIVPSSGMGGSETWLAASEQNAVSLDDKDLKTIVFTCGNTIKSEVLVVPSLDIEVDAQIVGAVSSQLKNYRVQLEAKVEWEGGGWQPPTKILFQAFQAPLSVATPTAIKTGQNLSKPTTRPLKPIGHINNPGFQDDVVKAGADGVARALLIVPQGAGRVSIKAIFLSPEGNEIWSSVEFIQVP